MLLFSHSLYVYQTKTVWEMQSTYFGSHEDIVVAPETSMIVIKLYIQESKHVLNMKFCSIVGILDVLTEQERNLLR